MSMSSVLVPVTGWGGCRTARDACYPAGPSPWRGSHMSTCRPALPQGKEEFLLLCSWIRKSNLLAASVDPPAMGLLLSGSMTWLEDGLTFLKLLLMRLCPVSANPH